MDIASLIFEAAELMLVGMIVVFVFLTILIFAVKSMSSIVLKFQVEAPQASVAKPSSSQGVPPAHIAAISAAVSQYRQKQQ
jgi:oxaloacetate decarboxylase gamma subunit